MRRFCAFLLVFILLLAAVSVNALSFNTDLIEDAKQAVLLMNYGEFQKAVNVLNFTRKVSGKSLASFAKESMPNIKDITVQSEVAVAYAIDSICYVAVPLEEPADDYVLAFVLRSKNGQQFDAYTTMYWSEVMEYVNKASHVKWQEAYSSSGSVVIPD